MGKDYTEFDHSDDNEDDDDDDIGALGSILSWDEDEDGVVGGTHGVVNGSLPNSALPDLVSFSHLKDKDSGLSYLQQPLVGNNGNHDVSTANLPLPTRINYSAATNRNQTSNQAPAPLPPAKENNVQQQAQLQQQQQQIRLQQQQIQQQQQQIQ